MFINEFTKDYIRMVMGQPRYYEQDYRGIMERSENKRRLIPGDPIPMTYQGFYFEEEDEAFFRSILHTMASIGHKVTAKFLEDPDYRASFHFSKALEDLILIDPGYTTPVPVGRYDIFYNGDGDFQFCELNTDGSSAMNEDRVLGKLLLKSKAMEAMAGDWEIARYPLFRPLVEALTGEYKRLKGKLPQTVAIVDFEDKMTEKEFRHFHEVFEKEGFDCTLTDPRTMEYREGVLYGTDPYTGREAAIDLVYRRMVTSDFLDRIDQCQDFLQAYKDQAFISMGSFRSQIMHAKTIFKVLHDPETLEMLSPMERDFVKAHVPLTKEILTQEDKDRVKAEKDDWILKPYNSYASQGILLGREHSREEWAKIVDDLAFDEYIYQEYIDVDPTPFLYMEDYEFKLGDFGHVIGLFMYMEEFAGVYARIGQSGIISGARDYFSAPAFRIKRKIGGGK